MKSKLRCAGCDQYRPREDMRRFGTRWVCDDTCQELVVQAHRVRKMQRAKGRRHKNKSRKHMIPGNVRQRVLERDAYCCRWCGTPQGVDLHHICYRSEGGLDDEQNLVALCRNHHQVAHSSKVLWQPILVALVRFTYEGEWLTVPEVAHRLEAA